MGNPTSLHAFCRYHPGMDEVVLRHNKSTGRVDMEVIEVRRGSLRPATNQSPKRWCSALVHATPAPCAAGKQALQSPMHSLLL